MNRFGFRIERSAAVSSSTSRSAGKISDRCGWSSTPSRSTTVRRIFSVTLICLALVPSLGWSAQVVTNWSSLGLAAGSSTSDAHGAAGPLGILAAANPAISYHTKAGTLVWASTEQAFFLPTVCCDARAVFDPASQRFFVIAQETNSTPYLVGTNLFRPDATNLYVNVSRSSNPQSSGTNDWLKYRFVRAGRGIDYPGLAIDAQAVHVTYGTVGQLWLILNKADLISGNINAQTLREVTTPSPGFQGMHPATVAGSQPPGNTAYGAFILNSTTVTVMAVTNVLGNPGLRSTNFTVPSVGNNNNALRNSPQAGTANRLLNGVAMASDAFWHDGDLWFCHTGISSNSPRVVIYYYRVRTGGFPNGQATLLENGVLDHGTNTWINHAAMRGNDRGDVCMVYTLCSSNTAPAMYAAVRRAGSSQFDPVLVRNSSASFTNQNLGTNVARWADYGGVSPDPDDQTFWVTHQVVTGSNNVNIWWGNVARDSLFFVDKNAVGSEIGTRELPYHSVRLAHTAVSGAKTLVIKPATYPEPVLPLRLDKNVRLENPYPTGNVRIGP